MTPQSSRKTWGAAPTSRSRRAERLRVSAAVCACVLGGALLTGRAADAQTRPAGRIEISGGAGWAGSVSLGSGQATLTGNGVPTGSPVVFFDTASTLAGGATFDGRLAWLVNRTVAIEGTAAVTRSELQTRITADYEGADPVTATERVNQFTIEAGLVVHLARFAGGRARPFVTGGGGYLRQLHDGQTLATDGGSGYVGGGLKYSLRERPRGWVKGLGLRADVRLRLHKGGFDLGDSKLRAHPAVTGGLFWRF